MDNQKHLGLRIDTDTHRKLKSIAAFEGRSINSEVLIIIKRYIAEHEKQFGQLG